MLGKAIRKPLVQSFNHIMPSKDWQVAESTQFLKTANVVVMNVCDEQSIEMSITSAQNLLTEVGTTVYQDAGGLRLNECRTAQTLVVRVCTATRIALAAYGWHAT
jgi:hypothetical protein